MVGTCYHRYVPGSDDTGDSSRALRTVLDLHLHAMCDCSYAGIIWWNLQEGTCYNRYDPGSDDTGDSSSALRTVLDLHLHAVCDCSYAGIIWWNLQPGLMNNPQLHITY